MSRLQAKTATRQHPCWNNVDHGEHISRLECLRCHHQWYPARPQLPRICPKCKGDWQAVPKRPGRPRKSERPA